MCIRDCVSRVQLTLTSSRQLPCALRANLNDWLVIIFLIYKWILIAVIKQHKSAKKHFTRWRRFNFVVEHMLALYWRRRQKNF